MRYWRVHYYINEILSKSEKGGGFLQVGDSLVFGFVHSVKAWLFDYKAFYETDSYLKCNVVYLRKVEDLEFSIKKAIGQFLTENGKIIIDNFEHNKEDVWRIHGGLLKKGVEVDILKSRYMVISNPGTIKGVLKSKMKFETYKKMLENG